jgi:hypothetical protein
MSLCKKRKYCLFIIKQIILLNLEKEIEKREMRLKKKKKKEEV